MKVKAFVILLLTAMLPFTKLVAAQGCYLSGDNVIYTFNTGTTDYQYFWFIPIAGPYPVYNSPLSTAAPSCPRAGLTSSTGSYCLVGSTRGIIYNYNYLTAPVGCPLDSQIELLVLITGCLGFFMLRNRNLLIKVGLNS